MGKTERKESNYCACLFLLLRILDLFVLFCYVLFFWFFLFVFAPASSQELSVADRGLVSISSLISFVPHFVRLADTSVEGRDKR